MYSRLLSLWLTCTSAATACLCNPAGPLVPRSSDGTCHRPVDETSSDFSPWSHRPQCLRTGTAGNGNGSAPDGIYCLYTFRPPLSDSPASIITTPRTAASLSAGGMMAPVRAAPAWQAPTIGASPAWQPLPMPEKGYRIVEIPGKGKGVIATRKLKRGEVFMVEYPALLLGVDFLRDAKAHLRRRLVRKGVERMANKEGIDGLARRRKKTKKTTGEGNAYVLDDVLAVNAVAVDGEEGAEGFMGLFLEFSRINHDCQPNARYRFSPRTLALEVFPYRTIYPGEEITVSYTPVGMPRDERHATLREVWGFSCSCSLCTSSDDAVVGDSDHRRRRVGELRAAILQAGEQEYYENALVMAHEWRDMGEEEGIPPLMAEYYDLVAGLSLQVGDLAGARRFALLALDAWMRFGSLDTAELEVAREFLGELGRLRRDRKLERKGVANMFRDAK